MSAAATRELTSMRQTTTVQIALVTALTVLIAGREALDLGRGVGTQLSIVVLSVVVALCAERVSRPHR